MISSKLATIGGFTVDNYGLYASGSNGSSIRIDSDGTIRSVGQNRTGSRGVVEIFEGVLSIRTLAGDVEFPVCQFQEDGSGMLAKGAIEWNSDGDTIKFNRTSIDALNSEFTIKSLYVGSENSGDVVYIIANEDGPFI
jgi:hypothetical protein